MKIPDIRMAAFDMDGTLLASNLTMTEATKEACRALQERGCKLVISTGRTYQYARLPIDDFPFDGYVCSNGALVYEKDGTLVSSTVLPGDLVVSLIDKLREKSLYYEVHDVASRRWMVWEDREKIEKLLDSEEAVEDLKIRKHIFYEVCDVAKKDELYQMLLAGDIKAVKVFCWQSDPTVLEWVREQISLWKDRLDVTSSGVRNVEIITRGMSKWQGVQYFCNKWGIDAAHVAAFGDSDNDKEILARAGVSVAMDNAPDEVKSIVRFIAGHHDQEGIARFIQDYLL